MAKMSMEYIDLENPVFRTYAFWSAVLVLKIFAMSILTGLQRFRTQVSEIL